MEFQSIGQYQQGKRQVKEDKPTNMEIFRNLFERTEKPNALRENSLALWSRRINHEHPSGV
ncbi:type II toxin-antitoxin system YoeB family toxin [Pseudopedobacter sp.]|uniref:type II toxin-antitoxin system YoeB family toxin n=1 Tax=Pseudopedobacter sp. TaxID=1936787 RepID=UPI00333F99EC